MLSSRINLLSQYLLKKFGTKVYKIGIDASLKCPNLDGTKDSKGCIFCKNGSRAPYSKPELGIKEQIEHVKSILERKQKATKFLAYFQAYSNTYGDNKTLYRLYEQALEVKDVLGLVIGTRPDCLEGKYKLLSYFNKKCFMWLELGLQSIHSESLKFLNRNHSYEDFIKTYTKLKNLDIKICVHLIMGIPGEIEEDFLKTVEEINKFDVFGVKFHFLHIIPGTDLEKIYYTNPSLFKNEEYYLNLIIKALRILKPSIVVHRLTGESFEEIYPKINKIQFLNKLENVMTINKFKQGDLWADTHL